MSSSWQSTDLVHFKSENFDRYKRNFLQRAVCELRFPTLLELGRPKPPEVFVKALRKEYPHLDRIQEMQLGMGDDAVGAINKHLLRSAKGKWSVSIKENAVSVETGLYTEYPEFRERIVQMLAAASKVIDSDFFTRIGLRYINVVETNSSQDPVREGWINKELVAPLVSGTFQGIAEYSGRLALGTEDGGCLLQHGLQLKPRQNVDDAPEIVPGYLLDIDVFRQAVTLDEVPTVLDGMHAQAFDVFDWALGEEARTYLSTPKTTKRENIR